MKTLIKEILEKRLAAACAVFLANDADLLKRNVHERAMTHKLAEALQTVFRNWDVDCEYNKDGKVPKTINLPTEPDKTVFPDIIIHKRGMPKNLLIIEAKKSNASRKETNYDMAKLDAYVSGGLGYKFALFLTFHIGTKPDVTYVWIPT